MLPNEDESLIGSSGIGPRTARGSLLTSFAQSEGMQICNRLFQQSLDKTYSFFHPSTGARQIDFILCGSLLDVVDAWTDSCISVGNDHQSVHARIRPPSTRNVRRAQQLSNKGWRPCLDNDGNAAL